MAITRAQQFKQMLREGGRIGFFTGMREQEQREQAANRREQTSVARTQGKSAPTAQQVRDIVNRGPDDRGSDVQNLTQQLVREGKTPREIRRITGTQNPIQKFAEAYTNNTRRALYNFFGNNPRNELDYLRSLPASQRALLSPALRAKLEELEDAEEFDDYTGFNKKFTFDEFEELRKFQPTEGLNFAEYAAKFKGAPGLLYSGDVGNLEKFVTKRDAEGRPLEYGYRRKTGDDDPSSMESDLEARLRKLEEQRKEVEEPVAENPLANLFARLMADGGRVGFRGGSDFGGSQKKDTSGADYGAASKETKEAISREQDRGATPTSEQFRDQARDIRRRDIPEDIKKAASFFSLFTPMGQIEEAKKFKKFLQMKRAIDLGENIKDIYTEDEETIEAPVLDIENIRQNPYGNLPGPNLRADVSAMDIRRKGQLQSVDYETAKDIGMINPTMTKEEFEGVKSGEITEPTGQFAAEGGRIGAMEGGIMDLETGRQMYFLGKLVKKATRAVKKIVKSPIGKAALGMAAFKFGPAIFGKGSLNPFLAKSVGGDTMFSGLGKFLAEKGLVDKAGSLTGMGKLLGGGLLTLSPLLFSDDENKDQTIDPSMFGPRFDIADLLARPYQASLGQGFVRSAADGGRIGYQEGSKEPVAKKTMPLLDMDGQEMDLRDNGGFVPIGRMEKADDVPARLSKNEFVFTADAVRNAGDGDIDKGAEVMYNMMKNLEDGGNVSEESQGLEGARNMFQTAQRLEEVL